jgi:PAS domain S-box-containing protein
MKITNSESIVSPGFTESDIETLKKYFEFNKKYYDQINDELTPVLESHPLWGPLLKMQTPEQRKQQSERSLEIQRAAIYDGKWEEYTKDLMTQGIIYARMNVNYSDWYGLIKMFKDYLLPYIKNDFESSTESIVTYLDGLSKFTDFAMYGIAEAYFTEKNNIIKANEERFRAIFENSADHIYMVDKNATISMINHVSSGMNKEAIIGRSIFDFQSEGNAELVKTAINTVFEKKEPSVFETSHVYEGNKRYYSSSVSPIFGEGGIVEAAVVISRDVTRWKSAEAEIKELNTNLEKKVNERTQELEETNKELESFSYSISHDLRSPLRAINGFTQILLEDYSDVMDEDAKDVMNDIIHNAKRMGELIDDLLEFSRLGKQGLTKGNQNMSELVRIVIGELKVLEKGREVEFDVKPLEMVKGDRMMLKQVMVNLVSNALKYSSKKQKSVIEIGCYKENGSQIYFVKDNGVGFDMAYYDKLFGVFQRLHSQGEFEGTGVGLAIVQRIIAKHGGKVWAEGKVNEGATFYISLPS